MLLWLVCLLTGTAAAAGQESAARPAFPQADSLPVVAEHHYRMAGRIRPLLLFWIGRDDVGSARVVWRRDDQGRGYELTIGSDPRRTPRQVNRWGYLAEVAQGTHTAIVGVMTQSEERSLGEVEARLARKGGLVFKALRGRVSAREATAAIATIHPPEPYTYRDVATVLDLLEKEPPGGPAKRLELPPGTRPGFLSAFAEILHRAAEAGRQAGASRLAVPRTTIPFVYNVTLYDLSLRQARRLPELQLGTVRYTNVIWTECELRSQSTGQKARFELTLGTEGALAEIPLRIVYQPRWWLQVELVLSDLSP